MPHLCDEAELGRQYARSARISEDVGHGDTGGIVQAEDFRCRKSLSRLFTARSCPASRQGLE